MIAPFDSGRVLFEIHFFPLRISLFDRSSAGPLEDPWLITCYDVFSRIGACAITKGPPDKAAMDKCLQSAITKFGAKHEREKTIKDRRPKAKRGKVADSEN